MIKKYFYLILAIILIIGAGLRTIKLDKVSSHMGNDEISIAFDSYSVRSIGKDEHGHSWPISFESHRTYKAPLYAYLNMPLNWLFGNNEYGVRMLSALSGIVVIFLVALIARAWSGHIVALAAALIMSLDPKSILSSRIALEANLAFFVMTFGIFLMYLYQKTNKKIYGLTSGLIMGLSLWGYQTQWGLTPIIIFILPWLHRRSFYLKKWLITWFVLIIVVSPIFYNYFTVQKQDPNNRASSQIWLNDSQLQDYLKNSSDNKIKKITKVALEPVYNYIQHFSFDSLFSNGTELFSKESPLESGWFLLATLPLLILGLANLKVVYKKYWDWVLAWWLLSPIVPALTYGGVTLARNLSFLVPTVLIMAAGFKILLNKSKIWTIIISILFFINFLIFADAYFIHYPIDSADRSQYGYKQAVEFIRPIAKKYQQIVVEPKFGSFGQFYGVPHLYFGYFGAFTVNDMQHRDDTDGTKIGKYYFKTVDWNDEELKPNSLYVVSVINPISGTAANDKLKLLETIKKPNGDVQFLIYETIKK